MANAHNRHLERDEVVARIGHTVRAYQCEHSMMVAERKAVKAANVALNTRIVNVQRKKMNNKVIVTKDETNPLDVVADQLTHNYDVAMELMQNFTSMIVSDK